MNSESMRPKSYRYWDQLREHIGSPKTIFNGKLTWPRQLEIHLPSDHKRPCNFYCSYCAGHRFIKDLGTFEMDALDLLRKLDGKIPYIIYGGSYTEPITNPYFMAFIAMTKQTGAHFGIHTNGSVMKRLEEDTGWLTELGRIAEDEVDYLSVSLDAGTTESHCKTKGIKHNWFSEILEGIRMAVELKRKGPAVRMCYLMNEMNSSQKEIDGIVKFARDTGVNSLRFSIPFAHYAQDFDTVRRYKENVEQRNKEPYYKRVAKHLSKSQDESPFIFWMSPDLQDVDLFNFKQCAYGYYQICIGADGYVYRCTTISTPTFKKLRLGKISDDLEEFKRMIRSAQDPDYDANKCFSMGGRCNRMGIEICRTYAGLEMPQGAE